MQIFHINNVNNLKKYNKRYKFDLGGFYCIYLGGNRDTNFDIFKKLKLNVLCYDDIYVDKLKFKSEKLFGLKNINYK